VAFATQIHAIPQLRRWGLLRLFESSRIIQDFPDSKAVQERIEAKLKSTGLNDPALKEAYDTLHAMD
jgi:hypothetical protein